MAKAITQVLSKHIIGKSKTEVLETVSYTHLKSK